MKAHILPHDCHNSHYFVIYNICIYSCTNWKELSDGYCMCNIEQFLNQRSLAGCTSSTWVINSEGGIMNYPVVVVAVLKCVSSH